MHLKTTTKIVNTIIRTSRNQTGLWQSCWQLKFCDHFAQKMTRKSLKGFRRRSISDMVITSLGIFFCLVCLLTSGCRPEGVAVEVTARHSPAAMAQKTEPIITIPATKEKIPDPVVTPESIEPAADNIIELQPPAETTDVTQNIPPVMETPFEDVTLKLPALSDPNLADKLITVNFDQADIRLVLKTISELTGINFIIDDNISGSVTVLSPTQIRLGDLYHFMESILEVKGFAAVPTADHVKIVQRSKASKQNISMAIGCDPAQIPQNDSVITQLMPLKYADAVEVSGILTGRLPDGAQLTTYPPTNTIIVTGTSANIHHIAKIIRQLDVSNAQEILTVIPLKYASAQVLSKQITDIMMQKSKTVSSRSRGPGQTTQIQTGILIKPDQRTNSLIVTANQQDSEIIKDMVRRLDIENPVGAGNVHVVYLKNANAKEVADSLSLAMVSLKAVGQNSVQTPMNITPDLGTSSLIINGSPQDYKVIAGIIEKLDIIREQVLVELRIIEVSEENLQEIGIDWATLDQAVSDSIRYFGSTNFGIRVDAAQGNLEGFSVGAFKEVGGNVQIGSILSALEKQSSVNILSTPHIVTSNHRLAKFIVGDNIPFVTNQRITETDPGTPTVIRTIDYKDVGVNLNITPHISQGGLIRLEIDSEFTQLIEGVTGLSADTPNTAKRQVITEISMADGSTMVIGGLIRDDKITLENKIPLLGDIPLLGPLFRHKRDRLQKTNLLSFITPHVINGQSDMEKITKQKQAEIAPELEKRLKGKNIENLDTSKSIWR